MSAPADETKQDESGPSESETELTARQEALIAALLSEPTQEAAADCRNGSTVPPASPPLELYLELVDRLTRAERRAVELELALRQSQRLLTENAESIAEREARLAAAEAKVADLEATKAPQKRSSWFSWLSRRPVDSKTSQSA